MFRRGEIPISTQPASTSRSFQRTMEAGEGAWKIEPPGNTSCRGDRRPAHSLGNAANEMATDFVRKAIAAGKLKS